MSLWQSYLRRWPQAYIVVATVCIQLQWKQAFPLLSTILHYTDSVIVTCTLGFVVVDPLLKSLIYLDLLSDIVMAMQNKQTVWIAGWNLAPGPLIREAFYSAKKLEKPGVGWRRSEAARNTSVRKCEEKGAMIVSEVQYNWTQWDASWMTDYTVLTRYWPDMPSIGWIPHSWPTCVRSDKMVSEGIMLFQRTVRPISPVAVFWHVV